MGADARYWIGGCLSDARRGRCGEWRCTSRRRRSANTCENPTGHCQQDKAAVDAAAGTNPPALAEADIPQALEKLHQSASGDVADDAAWEALVTQALSIVKGENNIRRRSDEDYQTKLRAFALAVQANPNSADAHAEFGNFIYQNAINVPGEIVEPRASFHRYRYLLPGDTDKELAFAQQQLDQALSIDPKNIYALTAKADMLIYQLQWADAETLLRQALQDHGDDPTLLKLFGRVMDQAANTHAFKANQLRTPEHWEDAWWIYTRYPSQSELDQADQHDEIAGKLWAISQQAINAAADKLKGTPDGFNLAALIARQAGNVDDAIANLQQSIKLAPDDPTTHDELADVYDGKQMRDEAADERLIAINLVQTTAAPLLRVTWPQISMTQFKRAKAALHRAMQIDPSDARAEAYLGMIALQDKKAGEAQGWFVTASALEEANARLTGRSGASNATGVLAPAAVGLQMEIDLHTVKMMLVQKKPAQALIFARHTLAAGSRTAQQRWYEPVPTSMLPGDNFDTTTAVPIALNVATMMAWAHVRTGNAIQLSGGNAADANREYAATVAIQDSVPPTSDAGTSLRMPVALASLMLGETYLNQGNPRAAVQVLSGHGIPMNQDRELWQRYNDTMNKAVQAVNQQH